MPMYTFKCPSCSKVVEVIQQMKDDTPTCKKCDEASCGTHTPKMERVYSNSGGFKLNGGGWFKDGYTKQEKPK